MSDETKRNNEAEKVKKIGKQLRAVDGGKPRVTPPSETEGEDANNNCNVCPSVG